MYCLHVHLEIQCALCLRIPTTHAINCFTTTFIQLYITVIIIISSNFNSSPLKITITIYHSHSKLSICMTAIYHSFITFYISASCMPPADCIISMSLLLSPPHSCHFYNFHFRTSCKPCLQTIPSKQPLEVSAFSHVVMLRTYIP